jgi:hypothetical protein
MRHLPIIAALTLLAPAIAHTEPVEVTATLEGHVVLPAQTFVMPPADAPNALFVSGRFDGNERTEQLYGNMNEETGLGRPFPGQPVQGFSGIRHLGGGRYLLLTDNGFGSRANSADAILMFHTARPDWEGGRLLLDETIFLSDPDRVIPYPITTEHSDTRYLTGADLDIEGIQPVGDGFGSATSLGPTSSVSMPKGR